MTFNSYIASNKRRTFIFVALTFFVLWLIIFAILGLITGFSNYSSTDRYGNINVSTNKISLIDFVPNIEFSIIITLLIILFLYINSTRITLSLSKAKLISKNDSPVVYNVVEEMAIAAGIPMPKVYIINDDALNAFACGTKEKGYICFTSGIINALKRDELQGVAGHELSHLRNGDSRLMTVIAGVGFAIGIIANIGTRVMWFSGGRNSSNRDNNNANIILVVLALVTLVFAPILTFLIQVALSRKREWLADDSSVELTRNPAGLRKALEKLENAPTTAPHNLSHNLNHLFISEPVNHRSRKFYKKASFMDTHPPLEARIKHLKELENG
jgi:heat shock protein HtpX